MEIYFTLFKANQIKDPSISLKPAIFLSINPLLAIVYNLSTESDIMANLSSLNQKWAFDLLMDCLKIDGITGKESAIAKHVASTLIKLGIPKNLIKHDSAHKEIPLPTECGNLIVTLPGTSSGPRLLFSTHLDTVPLCAGAIPLLKGKKITASGKTALGGDNRTGVACLMYLAAKLIRENIPHPPITLLFTVREESGLFGARYVKPQDLGNPAMGFNVDGRGPEGITIGAVGAERFEVEIFGRASHAGVYPEKGISSIMVASIALAKIQNEGWFGKIQKKEGEGTSNIGVFSGKDMASAGDATNVVTDYVYLKGEARSHDSKFIKVIRQHYQDAFNHAATKVLDDKKRNAKVKFHFAQDYFPFKLKENEEVITKTLLASKNLGYESILKTGNGGLDANWLVRHGIPTVTYGAGQNNIHTVEEFVDTEAFWRGCQFTVELAKIS